jgi:hypothetical protein
MQNPSHANGNNGNNAKLAELSEQEYKRLI